MLFHIGPLFITALDSWHVLIPSLMPFLVFFLLFAGDDLPVLNIEKETPQPDCWRKLCAQCAVCVCTCLCAHVRKPTTALCLLQLTEETWWWRQTLTCRYSEQSVSVRTATDTHTHTFHSFFASYFYLDVLIRVLCRPLHLMVMYS